MGAAMKFGRSGELDKLEMNMTPMIDVCFQLIIFFMLSMRLFSPEGDFSITMPLAAPREGMPPEAMIPPVRVRLSADRKGNLASIQMGQRMLTNFKELHEQIREVSRLDPRLDRGPGATSGTAEVELDCDYNLKFEYVVEALSAVAGYVANDKQTVVRMIDKIRFAPPRKAPQ
jgi:biopolymer transport protein ExbD